MAESYLSLFYWRNTMKKIAIVGAKRTPMGKFKGSYKELSSATLAANTIQAALKQANINGKMVDKVILGSVLTAGEGQNVARQAAIHADIPVEVPAMTINQVCGSGMEAIELGRQMIELGRANCVVVGGVENMSRVPFLKDRYTDDITNGMDDGLVDAFSHEAMGVTAEKVAERYCVTRSMQDDWAFRSQKRATNAMESGLFDEECIQTLPIQRDECIRTTTTLEKMATLPTVFKENGTVTAGNSSALSDGAAIIVLMDEELAKKENIPVLATLGTFVEIGMDPEYMGFAPYHALQKLSYETGMALDQFETIEINEAFAAQTVAVVKELGLDETRVNPLGGAIALGHPLGASGARIMITLLYHMIRQKQHLGAASLCIGGGMGMAFELHV